MMELARKAALFATLRAKCVLYEKAQNVLVSAYVRNTPRVATESPAREALLQLIAEAQRKCAFRVHSLETAYTRLGKEIMGDGNEKEGNPDNPNHH